MKSRSTTELIVQLKEEAAKHFAVEMAVGFENTTIFISSDDENGLQTLNDALRAGGTAMGLMAADQPPKGTMTVTAMVYPEHAEDEKVLECMQRVADKLREQSPSASVD